MNGWIKTKSTSSHTYHSLSISTHWFVSHFTCRIQFTTLSRIECVNLHIKKCYRIENSMVVQLSLYQFKSRCQNDIGFFSLYMESEYSPHPFIMVSNQEHKYFSKFFVLYWIDIIGTPAGIITFHRWKDHVFFYRSFKKKNLSKWNWNNIDGLAKNRKKYPKSICNFWRWNCEQSGIDFQDHHIWKVNGLYRSRFECNEIDSYLSISLSNRNKAIIW